ncbi:hypothetical protein IC620_16645 [Hazenella sp. IB182357]|uniref:Uncharacterized protein n=1 Tax=Polycladospora coralii TaxID=2771432 RepID=A0A926NC96_9BACL|nr:hypothetical protein [Polycladospora coralii]MBD1373973.1 hypothetical protein [Polycladospora coralii]
MGRKSKEIKPLFPEDKKEEITEEQPVIEEKKETIEEKPKIVPQQDDKMAPSIEKEAAIKPSYAKYKKKPKYETHVPHNVRIPKELRKEIEQIGKALKVPLSKNSGFFQDFTIDALQAHVDKVKSDLGIK